MADIDNGNGLIRCALGHAANRQRHLYTLGSIPVAGYLEDSAESSRQAQQFESSLFLCAECGLVHQSNTIVIPMLSQKIYADYQPTYSLSPEVTRHATSLLKTAATKVDLRQGDTVIEVGSNDGHFLEVIRAAGYQAVGFEPSSTTMEIRDENDIKVIPSFFGKETATEYAAGQGQAKLLITRHTLEHALDVVDFLEGISVILRDDGLAVIEVPYLHHQMLRGHIESMSFQHRVQFTVGSLDKCLDAAGLVISAVSFVDFDGGSMVVSVQKKTSLLSREQSKGVGQILLAEKAMNLDTSTGYEAFFRRISIMRSGVREFLGDCARQGKRICAYGAGGKGQNIINLIGLESTEIELVVDDNPNFRGKYIPGTGIPVASSDDLGDEPYDIVLISAPTHYNQLVSRQLSSFQGAQYVLTVPDFHILST